MQHAELYLCVMSDVGVPGRGGGTRVFSPQILAHCTGTSMSQGIHT